MMTDLEARGIVPPFARNRHFQPSVVIKKMDLENTHYYYNNRNKIIEVLSKSYQVTLHSTLL